MQSIKSTYDKTNTNDSIEFTNKMFDFECSNTLLKFKFIWNMFKCFVEVSVVMVNTIYIIAIVYIDHCLVVM